MSKPSEDAKVEVQERVKMPWKTPMGQHDGTSHGPGNPELQRLGPLLGMGFRNTLGHEGAIFGTWYMH